MVYYRVRGTDGKARLKKEYFGRGAISEADARKRHDDLGLLRRRPRSEDRGPSFAEVALAYSAARPFSANSRKHLTIRLEANLLPHFGHLPAAGITDEDVDAYMASRRDPGDGETGVKWATIRRELVDLKAILSWAARRQPRMIPANPVRDYKSPREDLDIIQPPSQAELGAILKHAAPHLVRAIMLSVYLGLRPGPVELLPLKWEDVDWEKLTITVRAAKKGGPQRRQVPIHELLEKMLRSWRAEDERASKRLQKKFPCIIHYHGQPVHSILHAWRLALAAAKIERRLRPYDLRHLFVTTALERGADIHALADVVGSKPETLWRHYQHVTRALHRQTIDLIPPMAPPISGKTRRKRKKA